MNSPIDAYLNELLVALQGNAPDVRRVLAEAEEHLRDAAAEGVAAGLEPEEAERQAVARFGSARLVARRFAAETPARLTRALLGQVVLAALLLGSVGLVAVGMSGGVAAAMGSLWGKSFVAGDPHGITYTAARCADFQEYHPRPTCEQAATAHHFDEVVGYRLDAGVLGLLGLGAYAVARRRRQQVRVGGLPETFVPTVAAAVFAVGGGGLLLMAFGQMGPGSGEYLSGALVALVAAGWYGRTLLRRLTLSTA